MISIALARMAGRRRKPPRVSSRPRNRFCSTVSSGTRLNSWKTGLMPIIRAVCGRQARNDLAPELEIASIRRIGAGDDVDQGGFAGAVLTEQNMNLAMAKIEIHSVQRHHAGKIFRYPGQLEQDAVVAGRRSDPRRACPDGLSYPVNLVIARCPSIDHGAFTE